MYQMNERPKVIGNLRLTEAERMAASALPGAQLEYAGCRYTCQASPDGKKWRTHTEGHGSVLPGQYRTVAPRVWASDSGAVMVRVEEDWGGGQSSIVYFRIV